MPLLESEDIINEVEKRDGEARLQARRMTLETLSEDEKSVLPSVEDPSEQVQIKAVPATEGELNELFMQSAEQEEAEDLDPEEVTPAEWDFLEDHIVQPEIEIERVEDGSSNIWNKKVAEAALVAIMSHSTGVGQAELQDKIEEAQEEAMKNRLEDVEGESFQGDGDSTDSDDEGSEGNSGE